MKKIVLFVLLALFGFVMIGCDSKGTTTEMTTELIIEQYDLTELTACVINLSDEDELTTCDNGDALIEDYANFFKGYLTDDVVLNITELHVSDLAYANVIFNIWFEGLPASYGTEKVELISKLYNEIYTDLDEITDSANLATFEGQVVFAGEKTFTWNGAEANSFLYRCGGVLENSYGDLRYQQLEELTLDFDLKVEGLKDLMENANQERLHMVAINLTDMVAVEIDVEAQTYEITVIAQGSENTPTVSVEDFRADVEAVFPGYTDATL